MKIVSTEKQGAIIELSDLLADCGKISDKESFTKDVLEREDLGSTGIGNNVGIPHARTSSVKGFVIAFGRSDAGIEFKALDAQPVKLVFLMGTDPSELNLYLRILAELSKLLMNVSFRQELLIASDAQAVIDVIKKFER